MRTCVLERTCQATAPCLRLFVDLSKENNVVSSSSIKTTGSLPAAGICNVFAFKHVAMC